MGFRKLIAGAINTANEYKIKEYHNDRANDISHIISRINRLRHNLQKNLIDIYGKVIGLAMPSSLDWIVTDFMLIVDGAISLPVPLDFRDDQLHAMLKDVECCLVNDMCVAARLRMILPALTIIHVDGNVIYHGERDNNAQYIAVPDDVVKIIHTSGTTSNPKGVMIKDSALSVLLTYLLDTFVDLGKLNYPSLVPMSLLIEQILGIYLPLLTGGSVCLMPKYISEYGASSNSDEEYLQCIAKIRPNFMYMPPKLLKSLNVFLSNSTAVTLTTYQKPFIITGGANVSKLLLSQLSDKSINIYEAYGLSETSSIISMNMHGSYRQGSAGKILPFVDYCINENELCVKGETLCAGYYTTDATACKIDQYGYLYTGDIVDFDDEGYLYIKGRKKNMIILSSSRNICPEWVEIILKKSQIVEDALVFGDGMDSLGVIIISDEEIHKKLLQKIICSCNSQLPDFAKISHSININSPEDFYARYYTITGRANRHKIFRDYKLALFGAEI